jgi:hypothetical protein
MRYPIRGMLTGGLTGFAAVARSMVPNTIQAAVSTALALRVHRIDKELDNA